MARPRPNIPMFSVFDALRLLFALIEVAFEALCLVTAANVSIRAAAEDSGLAARLATAHYGHFARQTQAHNSRPG